MGISDLPDDLLSFILVRLPIEFLGQLKTVSKPWNSLISSQKFTKSHLIHSRIVQKPNVLVPELEMKKLPDLLKMVEFSINPYFDYKSKRLHCLSELLDERVILQIVGSCNGLVCLLLSLDHGTIFFSDESLCDYSFVLCNPLTKSTWDLPGNQWKRLFSDESLYGFWFDDVNDDYKVVVMNRIREKEDVLVYECEVYSLKFNSWSKVTSYLEDCSCDYKVSRTEVAGVLFDGALHWILLDDRCISNSILAFDLRTYTLNILHFPMVLEASYCIKLTVLDDSLVLSNGGTSCELYDLWMMKKDTDFWICITIAKSYSLCSFTPIALLEDENHKRILVSYDGYEDMLQLTDLLSYQNWSFRVPCQVYYKRQLQFVGSFVQPYPPSVRFDNIVSEDALKNFEKFCILVNGVSIDSQLPEHVRRKYYDLCCSRKSFLHERLVPGVRPELAVRMIFEVVNIVDSVRSCQLTTSKEEMEKWEKTGRSLELLGMNVGFLRDRIHSILSLAFDSEEGIEAKKYWEVESKRARIQDEIEDLENKLLERKRAYKKYGDEADELKPKAKSYELMFQEKTNAPW